MMEDLMSMMSSSPDAAKKALVKKALVRRAVKKAMVKKAIKRKAVKKALVKKAVKSKAVKKAIKRKAIKRRVVKKAVKRKAIKRRVVKKATAQGRQAESSRRPSSAGRHAESSRRPRWPSSVGPSRRLSAQGRQEGQEDVILRSKHRRDQTEKRDAKASSASF
jgi:hypothetical protein